VHAESCCLERFVAPRARVAWERVYLGDRVFVRLTNVHFGFAGWTVNLVEGEDGARHAFFPGALHLDQREHDTSCAGNVVVGTQKQWRGWFFVAEATCCLIRLFVICEWCAHGVTLCVVNIFFIYDSERKRKKIFTNTRTGSECPHLNQLLCARLGMIWSRSCDRNLEKEHIHHT